LPSDPVVSGSVGRRWTDSGSGLDYSIALEQELDLSGRRGLQLGAARSAVRAREAEQSSAEWTVHQQVHAAYHQALVARERLAAAARMQAFAERLAVVAEQRFRAGETSPLPARLAAGEVAQARQAALQAASDYESRRLDLARTAGWTERALLTPAEELEAPEQPPDVASLIRTAHERQPALRAARARHQAARAQLSSAERRAWPNPTLGVNFENEAEPGASPARTLSGTFSVPLPFWVGSKPEASRARGALEQASAERAALVATLEPSIIQAHARVSVNAERALLFGAEILPTFEKNLELLQKAFELGEIDILQVLVAQERFLDAQQDALQAFADYYDSWAELEAAVGAELHESAHASTRSRAGTP
jgi:cobalt-zinc-cadmium efflux system outer membrane protein